MKKPEKIKGRGPCRELVSEGVDGDVDRWAGYNQCWDERENWLSNKLQVYARKKVQNDGYVPNTASPNQLMQVGWDSCIKLLTDELKS